MSLLEACKDGNVEVVEELLEGGADPNQADEVSAQFVSYSYIVHKKSIVSSINSIHFSL